MANARNKYVEYSQSKRTQPDFTIVVDMDVAGGYSYDGLLNSIGYMRDKDISFMGSNSILYRVIEGFQERLYYDTFAYKSINDDEPDSGVYKNLMSFSRGDEPFEVKSCFGGVGVYSVPLSFKYNNTGCDHITMHEQMRAVGHKIYMNPSMITLQTDTIYSYAVTQSNYITIKVNIPTEDMSPTSD